MHACRLVAMATALGCSVQTAAARPDVTQMTCQQAQALVLREGGVVATTGPNTYRRFVSTRLACELENRFLHPAFTRTSDTRSCRIGYTCENYSYFFSDDD